MSYKIVATNTPETSLEVSKFATSFPWGKYTSGWGGPRLYIMNPDRCATAEFATLMDKCDRTLKIGVFMFASAIPAFFIARSAEMNYTIALISFIWWPVALVACLILESKARGKFIRGTEAVYLNTRSSEPALGRRKKEFFKMIQQRLLDLNHYEVGSDEYRAAWKQIYHEASAGKV